MKICILTLNLGENYGGILQAFALQYFLKKEGHSVETVQHCGNQKITFRLVLSILKQTAKKYLFFQKIDNVAPEWAYIKRQNRLYLHLKRFIKQNMILTPRINNFNKLNRRKYDAFIVGSDQVWRPKYNKYFFNEMFLSFVKGDRVKRIAFAASLGVSDLEFTSDQIDKARLLLSKFDSISVREDTGVDICRKYFHLETQHVLDPTMLLYPSDYMELIALEELPQNRSELWVYALDQSRDTVQLIQQIADLFHYQPCHFLPELSKSTVYPPVNLLLKGVMGANFVITDSFHGTVFSILFNKPFLVIDNKERGSTRLQSLLKTFHLQDRLVTNMGVPVAAQAKKPIDWENVNNLIEQERKLSIAFIHNALYL